MANKILKYISSIVIVLFAVQMIFGISLPHVPFYTATVDDVPPVPDSIWNAVKKGADSLIPALSPQLRDTVANLDLDEARARMEENRSVADSVADARNAGLQARLDSLLGGSGSGQRPEQPEKKPVAQDTMELLPQKRGGFNEVIHATGQDSMIFDVRTNKVYIYNKGDVTYGPDMNLKADYISMDASTKEVYAYGSADTLGNKNRPVFDDGKNNYLLDTITFNVDTKKAKIKGIQTQDGDGYFVGSEVKMSDDGSMYARDGRYTTCDLEHPHFYFRLTRAKVIPNKKVITGYAYLVVEGVDVYAPGIPEAFFPLTQGRSSGIIVPSFGEETRKGFFLRGGGYYFALGEHADLTVLGGIYTLGSWEASVASRYVKRYSYTGNLNAFYSQDIIGDRGAADFVDQRNFKVNWDHRQDPKFRPGTNFSASVQFQTAGYGKSSSTTNINDRVTANTSSSISYARNWAGTPSMNFSAAFRLDQNLTTDNLTIGFPDLRFGVSTLFPFRRKLAMGKQRWYEKISISYTNTVKNTIRTQSKDLFTEATLKSISPLVTHSIPVSASYNVLNHVSLTPSFNYNENWQFRRFRQEYDPVTQSASVVDTTYGFYRTYNYSMSVGASTRIYGMYDFSGTDWAVRAVRHTISPTVSLSYSPDFNDPKFGFRVPVQSNAAGDIIYYSPFDNAAGGGRSASVNMGLVQNIEAKVRSKRDTTGVKKIKVLENFSLSTSYNFLADSLNLSEISFGMTIYMPGLQNMGLRFQGSLDPYQVDLSSGNPVRINKFIMGSGGFLRLTRLSTALAYSFNSKQSASNAPNQMALNSPFGEINPFFFDPDNPVDAAQRRILMANTYYDFSVPWNISINYNFSYSNNGQRRSTQQTAGLNGSINLTPNMGLTFNVNYDFEQRRVGIGSFTLSRSLHCWQFSFVCNPFGTAKFWSFNISAVSPLLRDLKYDRRNNSYDATVFDDR